MKYWEIIADSLSKAGWSWGCVSATNSNGGRIGLRSYMQTSEKLRNFIVL